MTDICLKTAVKWLKSDFVPDSLALTATTLHRTRPCLRDVTVGAKGRKRRKKVVKRPRYWQVSEAYLRIVTACFNFFLLNPSYCYITNVYINNTRYELFFSPVYLWFDCYTLTYPYKCTLLFILYTYYLTYSAFIFTPLSILHISVH